MFVGAALDIPAALGELEWRGGLVHERDARAALPPRRGEQTPLERCAWAHGVASVERLFATAAEVRRRPDAAARAGERFRATAVRALVLDAGGNAGQTFVLLRQQIGDEIRFENERGS
jgi:hypothetical protein